MNEVVYRTSYSALASGYGSFLMGLGGVSITILTLVLTLSSEAGRKSRLYPLLVSTLILAMISCFVGAHLMTETAALTPYDGSDADLKRQASGQTLRFFMVAEPNIFISATLFLLSLMLLSLVYGDEALAAVSTYAFVVFSLLGYAGVLLWQFVTINYVGIEVAQAAGLAIVSTATFTLVGFLTCKRVPMLSFYLTLAAVFVTLAYFAVTVQSFAAPDWWDVAIFVGTVSAGAGSLLGLGTGVFVNRKSLQGPADPVPA